MTAMVHEMNDGIFTRPGPMPIRFRRVREGAPAPVKANQEDAGWDVAYWPDPSSNVPPQLHVRGNTYWYVLPTGIAVDLPPGWALKAEGRSGLAAKEGVGLRAGVIDAGYQGELRVVLSVPVDFVDYHTGKWPRPLWVPRRGDRVAQLLLLKVPEAEWVETDEGEFRRTDRGTNGMGSTGE